MVAVTYRSQEVRHTKNNGVIISKVEHTITTTPDGVKVTRPKVIDCIATDSHRPQVADKENYQTFQVKVSAIDRFIHSLETYRCYNLESWFPSLVASPIDPQIPSYISEALAGFTLDLNGSRDKINKTIELVVAEALTKIYNTPTPKIQCQRLTTVANGYSNQKAQKAPATKELALTLENKLRLALVRATLRFKNPTKLARDENLFEITTVDAQSKAKWAICEVFQTIYQVKWFSRWGLMSFADPINRDTALQTELTRTVFKRLFTNTHAVFLTPKMVRKIVPSAVREALNNLDSKYNKLQCTLQIQYPGYDQRVTANIGEVLIDLVSASLQNWLFDHLLKSS